jgi:carboxymethylenebutenolidase
MNDAHGEGGRARYDLAGVLDAHLAAEFQLHSVDATMATMSDEPYLLHVPTSIGGVGRAEVERFYRDYFVSCWPEDLEVLPVSRTVGEDRVVDELIVSFTHTCEIPVLLPGIAPTGRRVRLPHVVVVRFEQGRVASEHIYWDQASLLVQVGLLDPGMLPVRGDEQAVALLEHRSDNSFVPTW